MQVGEKRSNYTPAPQGINSAICVDVIDLGEQKTDWGPKRMLEIRWQLEEIDPATGRRFLATRRYTASLGTAKKPSKLREHLKAWRGREFTPAELENFELDKILGANCQLQILHKPKDDGGFWAQVENVLPLAKGMATIQPNGYERVKDRQPQGATTRQASQPQPAETGEESPF